MLQTILSISLITTVIQKDARPRSLTKKGKDKHGTPEDGVFNLQHTASCIFPLCLFYLYQLFTNGP